MGRLRTLLGAVSSPAFGNPLVGLIRRAAAITGVRDHPNPRAVRTDVELLPFPNPAECLPLPGMGLVIPILPLLSNRGLLGLRAAGGGAVLSVPPGEGSATLWAGEGLPQSGKRGLLDLRVWSVRLHSLVGRSADVTAVTGRDEVVGAVVAGVPVHMIGVECTPLPYPGHDREPRHLLPAPVTGMGAGTDLRVEYSPVLWDAAFAFRQWVLRVMYLVVLHTTSIARMAA